MDYPAERCGYEWPADCERVPTQFNEASHPSCCARWTADADTERCLWHAHEDEISIGATALVDGDTPPDARDRPRPFEDPADGTVLAGCDLTEVDSLSGVALRGSDLSNTDLTGVDLSDASLGDADLSGATLTNAELTERES
jgi:Uncharacterized low-complexity proteins